MMPRTKNEQAHERISEDVKAIARRQMAEQGTASISLRAIAREMGITAPAIYRYFPSLDDLITALVLDAFNALADHLETVRDSLPVGDPIGRLWAMLLGYREWALLHPTEYMLIYGNPIPGYHAPGDLTIQAAGRTMEVFVGVLKDAYERGLVALPEYPDLPASLRDQLTAIASLPEYDAPLPMIRLSLSFWALLQGLVTLELYSHTPPVVGDPDAFYRDEMRQLFDTLKAIPPP